MSGADDEAAEDLLERLADVGIPCDDLSVADVTSKASPPRFIRVASRLAADVSALLAVFTAARARRPAACLVEIIEASALLNLDVREAARVATACGAAEAAAAAAEENEREANDADETRKGDAAAAARAAAAAAREAVGVFVLDDAVAFAVLSRRADLGAKKGT